jgi:hypothetical protein
MICAAVKKEFMKPVAMQRAFGNTHPWDDAVTITNGTIQMVTAKSTQAKFTTKIAAVFRRDFVRLTARRTKQFPNTAVVKINAITIQ